MVASSSGLELDTKEVTKMPKTDALKEAAKGLVERNKEKQKSLWDGPYSQTENGGITFSMLSKFLSCRERFHIRYVRGLKAYEGFDYKMEYGNAWHYCEELLAGNYGPQSILIKLKHYCQKLVEVHPQNSVEINKLYQCIKVQFPAYVEYWSENEDVVNRKPLHQERVFEVIYTLPSGRKVVLRGKIDAEDLISKKLYIQEDKSKSDIKPKEVLKRELMCDLQSMMYVVAVDEELKQTKKDSLSSKIPPIGGVRYNIVRRPLSSMKFNIKQRKGRGKAKTGAETEEQFYERLGKLIRDNASQFFVRMKIEVDRDDIEWFKSRVLNPILEQLCDWWDSIQGNVMEPFTIYPHIKAYINGQPAGYIEQRPNPYHFIYPFGVYNPTLEGRESGYEKLIYGNDERGFERSESLFEELKVK